MDISEGDLGRLQRREGRGGGGCMHMKGGLLRCTDRNGIHEQCFL